MRENSGISRVASMGIQSNSEFVNRGELRQIEKRKAGSKESIPLTVFILYLYFYL